jgi:hypothetical protein
VSSARTCRFSETVRALKFTADRHSANAFPGGTEAHRQAQKKLSELPKPSTPGGAQSFADGINQWPARGPRRSLAVVGEGRGRANLGPRSCLPWCGIGLATWN